ncbi:uroporphyrinogen-III synthase [Flavihumibacter rivuli]|uniref:uroporphyrinogen-III synthase n=1 Tax=Flavihumibacter rivuli TaxID=2838156 RepID=UPI001BDEB7E7|nr:uroporphyrinogen-III synthase [Flavihumibacter rivuli]ULQ55053.1 uroporphyrinogen-III synthase [Flavihumibacter rivuli]
MANPSLTILSTRPVDKELVDYAANRGIQLEVQPFITTVAIDDYEVTEEIRLALEEELTVVFTSMNAVEAVAAHMHDFQPNWRVYCMGYATKKLVEEYFGEDSIVDTGDDATDLAEKIIESGEEEEVTFFCGDQRRDELPEALRGAGIDVNEVTVYQTIQLPHEIKGQYAGILFFSPSAVHSFFEKNKKLAGHTVLFAIGNTTAKAIKEHCTNPVVIADEPGKSNLVEQAIDFFSSK